MEINAALGNLPDLITAIIVIAVTWLMPIPSRYSPLRLAQGLARLLALKVNKPGNPKQQQIAGALALLTYFVIILPVLWALLFVMPADAITNAVLLWISLTYDSARTNVLAIKNALNSKQNNLARSLLHPINLADSDKLSGLGATKATLEMQIERWLTGWLIPIGLFIFVGGIASLCFTLLAVASHCWPRVNDQYFDFGEFSAKLKSLFETIGLAFCLPLLLAFKNSSGFWKKYQNNRDIWPAWQSRAHLLLLCIVASGLKSELAGPVMADGIKKTRPRLNHGDECSPQAILTLNRWLNQVRMFVVVVLLLFWLVANFLIKQPM